MTNRWWPGERLSIWIAWDRSVKLGGSLIFSKFCCSYPLISFLLILEIKKIIDNIEELLVSPGEPWPKLAKDPNSSKSSDGSKLETVNTRLASESELTKTTVRALLYPSSWD